MTSCANCNEPFKVKAGNTGFYRFSFENKLPGTASSAREHLENLTGEPITPVSKKLRGQFLCPQCWNLLNTSAKYKQACRDFLSKTASPAYIGSKTKRRPSQSVSSPGTSLKRPKYTSTPIQKKTAVARSVFGKGSERTKPVSKWDTIITAIRARQYRRAIKGLYNATKASRRHFISVSCQVVRKELHALIKAGSNFPLGRPVDVPSIQDFSWDETFTKASEMAPLLSNVIKAAVTTKSNEESLVRGNNVQLKPKIGTSLAMLLHARAPNAFSFLPTVLSIQFWRARLRRETMKQISHLGICKGPNATLSAIDRIRSNFDDAAVRLKKETEKQYSTVGTLPIEQDLDMSNALASSVNNMEDEVLLDLSDEDDEGDTNNNSLIAFQMTDEAEEDVDTNSDKGDDHEEIDAPDSGDDVDVDEGSDDESIESAEESSYQGPGVEEDSIEYEEMEVGFAESLTEAETESSRGFTFCWDNVGKKVVTRRPNQNVKNTYINMALGYLAINRVQTTHLVSESEVIKAVNIPIASFVPGEIEFHQLRTRMEVIVGRILVRHLKWYKDHFSKFCTLHVHHDYTMESATKSVLINLGVFKEDPSSTQGAIGIYTKLQQYVPVVDGRPCPVLVYGDGLSCERGNDAQRARANGLNPIERLEGLEPAAQEFHKEMILLQDVFDDFFRGSSAADRGTISQIKNMFNYRQVKADISDNFSHSWDLLCLITEAYVCLLTSELQSLSTADSRPSSAPKDIEFASDAEKEEFFQASCKELVKKVWHTLDVDRLKTDDGTALPVVCCGQDTEEDLIGCECRSSCPNGEFFHYSCVNVNPANISSPWYCSEECKNRVTTPYQYCKCRTDLGTDEPMIGCSAEDLCAHEEWFHMKCVGVDPSKKQQKHWFCSDTCRRMWKGKGRRKGCVKEKEPEKDFKMSYSLALLWRGLNLLCRRDAVREADGDAMMAFWKLDLVQFFGKKHPKYVILTHRLLASINGWLPARLRHDLMHNRTVNYGGGIGRNLPLDFMNEILNRLFKDLLEAARGRYTETTIDRCSQIVGPFGEALDTVFDAKIIENEVYRHRRRSVNRDNNVSKLVEFLIDEDLFKSHPGRKHSAFPDFEHDETPKQAGKFVGKMKQLSKRIDKRRHVVIDA